MKRSSTVTTPHSRARRLEHRQHKDALPVGRPAGQLARRPEDRLADVAERLARELALSFKGRFALGFFVQGLLLGRGEGSGRRGG